MRQLSAMLEHRYELRQIHVEPGISGNDVAKFAQGPGIACSGALVILEVV